MKRIICMVAMLSLGWSASGKCEEPAELKGVSGAVTLKSNWASSASESGVFSQTFSVFVQSSKKLGLGGDFTYKPKGDYFEYSPYLTLNSGSHYLLAGILNNSLKGNFVQTGYWYIGKYADFNLVADLRAYLGTNDSSKSFLDNYFEVNYPVAPKVNLGIIADDTCSLAGNGNKISIGPIAYYKISKSVTMFGFYFHGWSQLGESTSQSGLFRLGVNYSF